jgi:hypothetical protein
LLTAPFVSSPKVFFIFATDFLSLLLTQKNFSPWLLTSQPLLFFFEIYTQKVRAVCWVVKNKIYMQKVEISVREAELCV